MATKHPPAMVEWRAMADAVWQLAKSARDEDLKKQLRAFSRLLHDEAHKREKAEEVQ
jgi:hypothetical protein